jgi:hypothetical protein
VCVWLEDGYPVAGEFEWSLILAACRGFGLAQRWRRRRSSWRPFFGFSPRKSCCSVLLGAFVACVVLVVVLLASERDVKLPFFLKDMVVLLPLILLKKLINKSVFS